VGRAAAFNETSGTGVGTNAGVTVTIAAVTGRFLAATGIQVSGDAAAVVTVESPSGTVLWRKRFAGAFNVSEPFARGALKARRPVRRCS
jgi:hypothetical protein